MVFIMRKKAQILVLLSNFISLTVAKNTDMIYILEWRNIEFEPFVYLGYGQDPFVRRNCSYQNCYLSANHSYSYTDVLDYDVILFNIIHVMVMSPKLMPQIRSGNQLYVLVALESSAHFHLPKEYDNYFNLTWTYKLDSDVPYPYIKVKNRLGEVVGPKTEMNWMDLKQMPPVSDKIISILKGKSIAAAWIVTNCDAKNNRLQFVHKIKSELSKYSLQVNIYGACGDHVCEKIPGYRNGDISGCSDKIKTDYYFYFAFENSFAEDYVTEKVIHGLRNYAVPVVYGGANYSRFMPDGIYLDAKALGAKEVAAQMNEIIHTPQRYYDFFRWHSFYSFHDTDDDKYRDAVCGFCALLNQRKMSGQRTVYRNISGWWNSPIAR